MSNEIKTINETEEVTEMQVVEEKETKMKKVLRWVKGHKGTVIAASGAVIGGVALALLRGKKSDEVDYTDLTGDDFADVDLDSDSGIEIE